MICISSSLYFICRVHLEIHQHARREELLTTEHWKRNGAAALLTGFCIGMGGREAPSRIQILLHVLDIQSEIQSEFYKELLSA